MKRYILVVLSLCLVMLGSVGCKTNTPDDEKTELTPENSTSVTLVMKLGRAYFDPEIKDIQIFNSKGEVVGTGKHAATYLVPHYGKIKIEFSFYDYPNNKWKTYVEEVEVYSASSMTIEIKGVDYYANYTITIS